MKELEQAAEESLHEAVKNRLSEFRLTQGEQNCYLSGAIFGSQWQLEQDNWISVDERLPEEIGMYLGISEFRAHPVIAEFYLNNNGFKFQDDITH